MLKSEKNILQRCDVRSPWKESSIVFILQKAKKNISSQCQRLNKKASMASLENSLCLGVLSALLAPTKRKLPKARLCNKMHWMSFYWLRARTVWCLSSKNRLECLITVIKFTCWVESNSVKREVSCPFVLLLVKWVFSTNEITSISNDQFISPIIT